MAKENITIDDLAIMVQKGFNEMAKKSDMDLRFEQIDKKFDKIEKDLSIIKSQLAGVVYKPDFDKLEMRVEYLENILALKKN